MVRRRCVMAEGSTPSRRSVVLYADAVVIDRLHKPLLRGLQRSDRLAEHFCSARLLEQRGKRVLLCRNWMPCSARASILLWRRVSLWSLLYSWRFRSTRSSPQRSSTSMVTVSVANLYWIFMRTPFGACMAALWPQNEKKPAGTTLKCRAAGSHHNIYIPRPAEHGAIGPLYVRSRIAIPPNPAAIWLWAVPEAVRSDRPSPRSGRYIPCNTRPWAGG